MEVAVVARRVKHLGRQVVGLRLELLHADEVGVLGGDPVQKAFVHGRPDAVEIAGYYTEHSHVLRWHMLGKVGRATSGVRGWRVGEIGELVGYLKKKTKNITTH